MPNGRCGHVRSAVMEPSNGHIVLATLGDEGFASLRRPARPRAERYELGRSLRERSHRSDMAFWKPPPDRADPVRQTIEAHEGRLEWLIPIRVGRMAASPYAFLRGSANIMADDFAGLPSTGITPVICGDAHLGNFGFYASPERELVFDLNDFDEAHPGAWEWDLRRLVVSVYVAGRQNGFRESDCSDAVQHCVEEYREQIGHLAEQPLLARSFDQLDVDRLRAAATRHSFRDEIERAARRARRRTSDRALPRFTEQHDGSARLVEEPPLITRPSEAERDLLAEALDGYLNTLPPHWARILAGYRIVDIAHKVVGVGLGRVARVRGAVRGQQPRRRGVPPAQAGPPVGGGAVHARRRGLAPAPGPAGGRVPAGAADGQRPAARLDHGRRPAVLRTAVPGHEGRDPGRGHERGRARRLRGHLRVPARQEPRPDQRGVDDRRVHRRRNKLDGRALPIRAGVRRPGGTRPRRARRAVRRGVLVAEGP